ncbi:MAG: adenosylcobinamide-GDP ribazoletransferase [Bryobacteraceae bacterium]
MRQALGFLTVLPLANSAEPPGRSAWAYPLIGALLGLAAAPALPLKFGPLLIVIALALITGGLHEDGLADVADAIRSYRSREKMLAILKDSRIGAHGALALIASFAFRWQALAALHANAFAALPVAFGISRAMMVLLAATAPPAGDGLGRAFIESLPRTAWILALVQAVALAALTGWPAALVLIAINGTVLALLCHWFRARLGGVTGDCLGAICQLSEAASLGALACL